MALANVWAPVIPGKAALRNLAPPYHSPPGLSEAMNVLRFPSEATESPQFLWPDAGFIFVFQVPSKLCGRKRGKEGQRKC